MLQPISTLINLSLSEGLFPDDFKHAIVTPLHKKHSLPQDELSSYRPISHLNFISKILERIIHSRLKTHLNTYPSLSRFQSAYRKFHSTELLYFEFIMIFFNPSTHKKFSGTALSLLSSYLSNRSQYVLIGNHSSSPSPLLTGVSPASVLGPLLFCLYTSPLSHIFSNSPVSYHLYADDTQLYISFSSSDSAYNLTVLSSILDSVYSWFTLNRLSVNPSKTEFLLVGTPQQISKLTATSVSFCDTVLTPDSCRNLGVVFDSDLSFKNIFLIYVVYHFTKFVSYGKSALP